MAASNPITHSSTAAEAARYKLEPYAVAADIYSVPPHVGRGGWSWYTGSAGWMQRVGIESILGVVIQDGVLKITPCIPRDWTEYQVTIAWRSASYAITVHNPDGVCTGVASIAVDGAEQPIGQTLRLLDDGATHTVLVRLGAIG